MKFKAGQKVVMVREVPGTRETPRRTVVTKVGTRNAYVGGMKFDGDTGVETPENTGWKLYTSEDWEARQTPKAAAQILRLKGVTVADHGPEYLMTIYKALQKALNLPKNPYSWHEGI